MEQGLVQRVQKRPAAHPAASAAGRRRSSNWERNYAAAEDYSARHGDLLVPARYAAPNGVLLGSWIANQRRNRKKGALSEVQISRLDAIGMVWDPHAEKWEKMFQEAVRYRDAHGDLNVPIDYGTERGDKLGKWLYDQRVSYFKATAGDGTYHAERARRLSELGMIWHTPCESWELGFEEARSYASQHGDLDVPKDYITASGFALGLWVVRQRQSWRAGTLSEAHREKLEQVSMLWSKHTLAWERGFDRASLYYAEHGDLLVHAKLVTDDGFSLGAWVAEQRRSRKNGALTGERIRKLDAIGMVWDPRAQRWEAMFHAAERYYLRHGNLDVPLDYRTEAGENLGKWLWRQRREYRAAAAGAGRYSQQRKERLERIGITWDAP